MISESGSLTLRLYIVEDENISFLIADHEKFITGRTLATIAVSHKVMLEQSMMPFQALGQAWSGYCRFQS